MSAPYPGAGPRDERPAPVLLPDGGIAIGAALCAELAAALEEYLVLLPAGRRGGRLSRPVTAVLLASKAAAVQHQGRLHAARALAAPTVVTPEVLGAAQLARVSGEEEITTTKAADIGGYSPEWWRRLAVRGDIRGHQVERGTWLLNRADVTAYATRQETAREHRHQDSTGPERQAG
ncbi:hypothetical protein [Streptacidiphilus sp. PAMC 29251]